MKCESCNIKGIEVEEFADKSKQPYRLCRDCRKRLVDYALRPLEFFNLAAIHGHAYYLQDDFYDFDTGEAGQPKTTVIKPELFPFPELADIKSDLKMLVDYACVQYETSDNVVDLLKRYDKEAILNFLRKKVIYNRAIHYKAYEIAAKVLGSSGREWILAEWENRKENELLIFSEAICKCLPIDEAFQLLTTEIERVDNQYFADYSTALIYLESPRVLDWIEKISNRIINVSTSWATISAASQFSWDRAEKWLEIGRPLSLVALDALVFCTTIGARHNQALWLIEHPPVLLNAPNADIIAHRITAYLENDKVPRTENSVAQIIKNLFATGTD